MELQMGECRVQIHDVEFKCIMWAWERRDRQVRDGASWDGDWCRSCARYQARGVVVAVRLSQMFRSRILAAGQAGQPVFGPEAARDRASYPAGA